MGWRRLGVALRLVWRVHNSARAAAGGPASVEAELAKLFLITQRDGDAHRQAACMEAAVGGLQVATATSIDAMLTRLPSFVPDVLVIDWSQPDGPRLGAGSVDDTIRLVSQVVPNAKLVIVVDENQDVIASGESPEFEVLHAPYDTAALVAAVARAVSMCPAVTRDSNALHPMVVTGQKQSDVATTYLAALQTCIWNMTTLARRDNEDVSALRDEMMRDLDDMADLVRRLSHLIASSERSAANRQAITNR